MKIKNNFLVPLFDKEYLKKRRQELPKSYIPNGAIYISSVNALKKYRTFYTPKTMVYIMPPERSIDIDSEFDFLFTEFLIKRVLI